MARDFVTLAEQVVDTLLAADPVRARWAGDHRADARLPDLSDEAIDHRVADLQHASNALAEIEDEGLSEQDNVDRQLLASEVDSELFALTEIDERSWDPLVHNPGDLFFALLVNETVPAAERISSLAGRLSALPDALATADRVLDNCPRIHVETALAQLDGTESLIRHEVPRLTAQDIGQRSTIAPLQADALAAIERHRSFLHGQLDRPGDGRDPRLGRRTYEAKLWHTLDSELTAAQIAERAQAELVQTTEQMAEVAERLTGNCDIRAALDRLAADHPDDATILPRCADALTATTAFVGEHDLVTLLDDPVSVIAMPEYARGVAAAYCDAPGPLETGVVPTLLAVSPTPADWPAERTLSFYREYNDHLLNNLIVHEAMPGHYLQLAHARRFRGSSRARALCESGTFIEGWAVYVEELMIEQGYGGAAVRLQQLKMRLRMAINAILDQGVHCDGMTEAEAMELMTTRGFQEEGEAAGKWRRALLSSAQLSTYFVGYTEVREIASARPAGTSLCDWHDAMLAHGSPSPRHLRRLLDV